MAIYIITYIILLLLVLLLVVNGQESKYIYIFSCLLLIILMSGHRYIGNGDSRDLYGYSLDYIRLANGQVRDYGFYYLFYLSQILAQKFNLSFYQWWALMTALSFIVFSRTIKKVGMNRMYFLFYFMTYFVFVFYTGLKFYYGACLLFCALSYLCIKNDYKRFIFYVVLAGGMHILYYAFLLLLVLRSKALSAKKIYIISISLTLLIFVIGRVGALNAIFNFLSPVLSALDSDNLEGYFESRVRFGFLIPVMVHLSLVLYFRAAHRFANLVAEEHSSEIITANNLCNTTLIITLFYPLYLFSLTFMRLLTAFAFSSLVISSSSIRNLSLKRKRQLIVLSMIPVGILFYHNIIMSDYWNKTVIPFFQNSFFELFFE